LTLRSASAGNFRRDWRIPDQSPAPVKTRDNGQVILPKAFIEERQFAAAVAEVERMLRPEVLRIRYTLGEDWTGDPAVFFRVVISDAFSGRDQIWKVTDHVSTTLEQQIEPVEQWGVRPYFNYRSQSEQEVLREEAWA